MVPGGKETRILEMQNGSSLASPQLVEDRETYRIPVLTSH